MRTLFLFTLLAVVLSACNKDTPVTVDEHINAGASIAELRELFPDDSLYGKEYQGGQIFYLNAIDEALIVSKVDISSSNAWGCSGLDVASANSISFGDGNSNTDGIVQMCTDISNAAGNCFYSTLENKSDWYLPTYREWEEIHNALHLTGIEPFNSSDQFWTSTQIGATQAYYFDFSSGTIKDTLKSTYLQTRGIRKTP